MKEMSLILFFFLSGVYAFGQKEILYYGENGDTIRGAITFDWPEKIAKKDLRRFNGYTYEFTSKRDKEMEKDSIESVERDKIIWWGHYFYKEFTNVESNLYDKNYADKLKVIHEMIGDDIYFMLGLDNYPPTISPLPSKNLWIIEFKKNRKKWRGDFEKTDKPTIAIESEWEIKQARDIRIIR